MTTYIDGVEVIDRAARFDAIDEANLAIYMAKNK